MEATLVAAPAQVFLPELDYEVSLTRRVLERAPAAKFDWQPHAKSMTLGQLAQHTADLVGWIKDTFDTTVIDFATYTGPAPTPVRTSAELLDYLAVRGEAARATLQEASADDFEELWTMRNGDEIIIRQSRAAVTRHLISHMIHHRGQLMVYLRLLDVPVPAIYGPSADEQGK
ncbi:DinB family protein [Hymenobacter sp. CRA2]|uniref:DinB family protein n=1 Tax=Hymenobacter sp. CRA2 TaxID=1955620 RepID=UPI00098E8F91|nr:DinB family protein [Hymenobacter sp. CRA2]OON66463.1 hypothetical protein B0919_21755 [Hymenobacter sp. CRA2]